MHVATDDDARAAGVFRWLGPAGHRFRRDHRGVSYGLAVGCALVLVPACVALLPTFGLSTWLAWLTRLVLGIPLGLLLANKAARAVMRRVDHRRTIRWHLRTLQQEIRSPRVEPAAHARVAFRPDLHVKETKTR